MDRGDYDKYENNQNLFRRRNPFSQNPFSFNNPSIYFPTEGSNVDRPPLRNPNRNSTLLLNRSSTPRSRRTREISNVNRDDSDNNSNRFSLPSNSNEGFNENSDIWGNSTNPRKIIRSERGKKTEIKNFNYNMPPKKVIFARNIYCIIILLLFVFIFQIYIIYSIHYSPQAVFLKDLSENLNMLPAPNSLESAESSNVKYSDSRSLPSTNSIGQCGSISNVKKFGESCSMNTDCCTNFCHPLTYKCRLKKGLGESCNDVLDCKNEFLCRGVYDSSARGLRKKNGLCFKYGKIKNDYECKNSNECESNFCDSSTQTCSERKKIEAKVLKDDSKKSGVAQKKVEAEKKKKKKKKKKKSKDKVGKMEL